MALKKTSLKLDKVKISFSQRAFLHFSLMNNSVRWLFWRQDNVNNTENLSRIYIYSRFLWVNIFTKIHGSCIVIVSSILHFTFTQINPSKGDCLRFTVLIWLPVCFLTQLFDLWHTINQTKPFTALLGLSCQNDFDLKEREINNACFRGGWPSFICLPPQISTKSR